MKEWQRWERMAEDFNSAGDRHREAECLRMALELLPPYNPEAKARLRSLLEEVGRAGVGGGGQANGHTDETGLSRAVEALGPEETREAVLDAVRRRCKTPAGAVEDAVVEDVLAVLEVEGGSVREAIVDLVDEGLLYREGPGTLMVDGVLEDEDLRTAVLGVLSELSTEGRGGSRKEVVRTLRGLGLPEDQVQEAIDELEESGRLEEVHRGQLRPALFEDQIEEVHHQVLSALRLMDTDGEGALQASVVRELTGRGLELEEVEEAIEELVDGGALVLVGGVLRHPPGGAEDQVARRAMLALVEDLCGDAGKPASPVRALREAVRKDLAPAIAHRAMEDLVDSGALVRTSGGGLLPGRTATRDEAEDRRALLAIVRRLYGHGRGAPSHEVLERAVEGGMPRETAREGLEGLIDGGLVHEDGDGRLRPG